MRVDWDKLEATVTRSAKRALRDFAARHPDEVFYGFFLDCNATYFEILGHKNTEDLLRAKAAESKTSHAALYKGVSVERLVEDLRWSGGDWGYFQMFDACESTQAYGEMIGDMIEEYTFKGHGANEAVYDQFLDMACRVAVRLERENAFDDLKRTPTFRILCADHDESVENGERRLQ